MNTFIRVAVQGAACGLVIGAMLLIGGRVWHPATVAAQEQQPAAADVVKARSFEVVDTFGTMRAKLGMGTDGIVGLGLSDATGETRAALAVVPDGTVSLVLFGARQAERAQLTLNRDKRVGLSLSDTNGKQRAAFGVGPDGSPTLTLFDTTPQPRATVAIATNGNPVFALFDAAGKFRAGLGLGKGAGLTLFDGAGNMRAALGTVPEERMRSSDVVVRGESSLALFGEDGKVIWKAP
jgi:hypothetical protein